jgi:hypothetical protein
MKEGLDLRQTPADTLKRKLCRASGQAKNDVSWNDTTARQEIWLGQLRKPDWQMKLSRSFRVLH